MNCFAQRIWLNISSLQFSLWFNANLFPVWIAVNCARQSFVLMKETKNLPLDLQVETLILSRRNKLEQLMRVPKRGWQSLVRDDPLRGGAGSRLSEMIHFGAGLVVAYPRWSTSGKRTSPVRSRILLLPIFIKEVPAFWWQSVLRQFSSKKIQLLNSKICH